MFGKLCWAAFTLTCLGVQNVVDYYIQEAQIEEAVAKDKTRMTKEEIDEEVARKMNEILSKMKFNDEK